MAVQWHAILDQPAVGAICWLAALQIVPVELIVAFGWRRPYDFATNYISDLGSTGCRVVSSGSIRYVCSPWHQAMNASFIVFGGLLLIGAVLLSSGWPRRGTAIAGRVLLCLAGACAIVIGMSPENVSYWPHALAGFTQLPFLNIGMILLGVSVLAAHRHIGLASISAGGVGMVATILYASGSYGPLGAGIIERLPSTPLRCGWRSSAGGCCATRPLRRAGYRHDQRLRGC